MKIDLDGKVALVTGAASGIGKACALTLAGCGAKVVLTDRNAQPLAEAAERVGYSIVMDVADRASIEAGIDEAIDTHGRIDILVNNAGIGVGADDRKTVDEFPVETWDEILKIDLTGVFLVGRKVAGLMKEAGGGSIVNIASIAGITPIRLQSPYVAAKAGVVNLTRSMAIELASDGIRVNAVAPGSTATEGWKRWIEDPKSQAVNLMELQMQTIPMRRPATTEEIANGVAFLASPLASYITGHTLVIDGGWMAGSARNW